MTEYRTYQVKVTVLTPLHIGSGRELLNEYDYAIAKGHTWRINEDTLLEAQNLDDPTIADRLAEMPPAQLLQAHDFQPDNPFFRYVIRGTPRSNAPGAQVGEQLKDVYDHPYLPGSSLKGALRTAIAWLAWDRMGLQPDTRRLVPKSKFAAQWYEQEIFSEHSGKAPNKDTLRALQVSDSATVSAERLIMVNARVLNRGGTLGSPIEIEAIRPDTVFELEMKLDLALFSEWARAKGLNLQGITVLQDLPTTLQQYSLARLTQERAWLERIPGAERVAAFYKEMQQARTGDAAFLLQLGWGTGWESKTFGSHLQADRNFMEAIVQSPRDGGYGLARGKRRPGDPFPKSRRVLVQVQRSQDGRTQEIPLYPLGWVLVSMSRGDLAIRETDWRPQFAEDDEYTPSAPVIEPPQEEKMPVAKPAPKPLIESFETIPQIGDRFKGEVFNQEGRALELFIPGLDDTVAAAYIAPDDNPTSKKYAEGDIVVCEVIGMKPIGRICQVLCRKV